MTYFLGGGERYEGVRFNVISVIRGWVQEGLNFQKKVLSNT